MSKINLYKLLSLSICLFIFFTINAFANLQKLRSASESNYPPFCVVNKDGEPDGFSVELLKYVANVMNIEVEFEKVATWSEIEGELKDGKLDILPLVSYSLYRTEFFDFTIPYITLYGAIFVRDDNTTIKGEGDLLDAEVIVMEGAETHEYILKNKLANKIITTKSYKEAFRKLSKGMHDAVVVQKIFGLRILSEEDFKNIRMVGNEEEVGKDYGTIISVGRNLSGFEQKFCFAVPKGNEQVVEKLNRGLSIAVNDGTFKKIYDKWFPFLKEKYRKELMIKYMIIVSTIIILVGLILISFIHLLRKKVKQRTKDIEEAHKHSIYMLALASEYKDKETSYHLKRMSEMVELLALEYGLSREKASQIKNDSSLHDLGKLGIPDDILLKKGKLTDTEYEKIKKHTLIGAKIINGDQWYSQAKEIAMYHHERWDGKGYPEGLKGEEIPLAARIVSIIDVFDALISRRPYKEPWPLEKALEEIENQSGKQFDPKAVYAFLTLYKKGKLNKCIKIQ
jgi:HD-GYP domain-containing protein (c-di-GMP phosphodiesterase class II)